MTEIIMKTYEYCDEIKQSPFYMELKTLNNIIEVQYQKEIETFNKAKIVYQEVFSTGGTYHPDFKESARNLSISKQALYQKPEVVRLLELEQILQKELNDLVREVAKIISPHIKVPNEVGLIKEKESCHASKKNGVHR